MKRKSSFPLFSAIIVGVSLLLVLWPLFRHGFYISDDGEWMVIRLSAFYQSLASGQFPVRFLGRLNNSYGYPVANFLYPGLLYIGSLLHVIGLSFPDAIKVILGSSVIGSAIAVFVALRSRFRIESSTIGTLCFVFSPYLLYDLYQRGSVGEVLAIFAASVAMLAISKAWIWLLTPAVTLLILSHNTVAVITGVAAVLLIWVHPKRTALFVSFVFGVLCSAFFWLPAIVERIYVQFDSTIISDPSSYFIRMENALLLGIPIIIALSLYWLQRKKFSVHEVMLFFIVVAGMFLSLPISFPLWQMPLLSRFVQFPYRLLVLPVIFGPWIIASVIDYMKGWRKITLSVLFTIFWIFTLISQCSAIQYVQRPLGYYTTNEGTTTVANEYMPIWVRDIPKSRSVDTLEIADGDAQISERIFLGETIKTTIDAKEASIVQINKIFYPGWGVAIDNILTTIDYSNPLGVMQIVVPQGNHTLVVQFRETPFRFVADVVSLISCIVFLIFIRRIETIA